MEFEVTISQCVALTSERALQNTSFESPLVTVKVAQIIDAASKPAELYVRERQKLLKQYCEVDEHDELKLSPSGSIILNDESERAELEQKLEDFLSGKTQISCPSLTAEELKSNGITVATIRTLLPFLK